MSGGAIPNPPPALLIDSTLSDLSLAWTEREEEAERLNAAGMHSMATALRLRSLEIRLKQRICRHLRLDYLPKACKTQDLEERMIFTGWSSKLDDPPNDLVRENWNILVRFSKKRLNDLRYAPRIRLADSEITEMTTALDDPATGVIAWLSKHP